MHAEIARELLSGRDPMALTLGGVRYVDKPPLLYALLGFAFALGGASETAARAVPALAALAAVAATTWLGARLLGPCGGFVAGMALLTSAGFFAFARYVRPETLFVAALAWGFALVLTGLTDERRWHVAAGLRPSAWRRSPKIRSAPWRRRSRSVARSPSPAEGGRSAAGSRGRASSPAS